MKPVYLCYRTIEFKNFVTKRRQVLFLATLLASCLLFPTNSAQAEGNTYYIRHGAYGTWGIEVGQCGGIVDGPTHPCSMSQAVTNVAPGDTVKLQDDGGSFTGTSGGYWGGWASDSVDFLTDGAMENWTADDLDSWTESDADAELTMGYAGNAAQIVASNTNGGIYQDVAVSTGHWYRLSFYRKNDAGSVAKYAIYDVDNSRYINLVTSLSDTQSWSGKTTDSFKIPAGCTTIRVYLLAGESGQVAYFDSVKVLKPSPYAPLMASGTSGNWITWEPEEGDTPILLAGNVKALHLAGLGYHHFKDIEFIGNSNHAFSLGEDWTGKGSHHIIFEDCHLSSTNEWSWSTMEMLYSVNNIILKNTTVTGYNANNQTSLDMIYVLGFTGGTIEKIMVTDSNFSEAAGHAMLEFQANTGIMQKIIVRNNSFENQIHTGVNLYGNPSLANNALFENNTFKNSGIACSLDGDCSEMISYVSGDNAQFREQKAGLQFAAENAILRRNSFYGNGAGITVNGPNGIDTNYIYNNTFYKNSRGIYTSDWGSGREVTNTWFINNLFRDNTEPTYSEANRPIDYDQHSSDFSIASFSYNFSDEIIDSFYYDTVHPSKTGTFNEMDSDLDVGEAGGSIWHDNIEGAANLENETGFDFDLLPSSDAINVGGPLTLVNDAEGGSGTSLVVDYASPFHDGSWCPDVETLSVAGLVCQPDYICVGDTSMCAQIVSISGDTIALASFLTWDDNDPVYLQKGSDGAQVLFGSAPDCGAYEYQNPFRADVDNSSAITTTDALLTLRNSLGLSMTGTAWQVSLTTGDVNCDGSSNSTDALLILRHSLGLNMGETGWCE